MLALFAIFCPSVMASVALSSVPAHAYFVERIAGKSVESLSALPPGADLHHYEPNPKQSVQMLSARLWIGVGAPYEERLSAALSPKIRLDLSGLITKSCCQEGKDIHIWMSPRSAQLQVRAIAIALSLLCPANASEYRSAAKQLIGELAELNQSIISRLQSLPNRVLLLAHPALAYFCEDYDLVQLSLEEEGKELKPSQLQTLLSRLKEEKVQAILVQKNSSRKAANTLAKALNMEVAEIDPLSHDYFENIEQLMQAICP